MDKATDCSVIAVYESLSDAQGAVGDLEKAGIKSRRLHLSSDEGTDSGRPVGKIDLTESETFTGWLKSIFTSDKNAHQQNYTRAYASGKHILSVEAAESELRVVFAVLNHFSPVDIHTDDYGAMHGISTADTYIWEFPQPPSSSDVLNAEAEMSTPATTTGSAGMPPESRGVRVYRHEGR